LTQIHLDIKHHEDMSPGLLKIWLTYFNNSVDHGFDGPNTEKIKTKAFSLGTPLQIKIQNQRQNND
jgi:hypothetical protein